MLRRIHDPERGAGFTEYGAVILLVAAITIAVITSGVSGRVQTFIASAIDAVGEGTAEGGDGSGGEGESTEDDGSGEPADDSESPDSDIRPVSDTRENEDSPEDEPQDDDDGGGGFWSSVGDTFSDIGDGIANAGTDAWDGVVDGWNGLVDGAERLWDDPGQWASDTWNGFTDGLSGTWDQVTSDPVGWFGDVLFSETVQENWANGNYWEAGSQAFVENAVAFIPVVGWIKKGERIVDIADGDGNDGDSDGGGDEENEDENDPSCTRPSSFVPGTPVLLADGSTVPIEDIALGDEVLAFDPLTGEEGPREVTDLISSAGAKTLVTLTVDTGDGTTDTLTATDEHPFWVPEQAEWVDAADLETGTWLRTSAGLWAEVTAVEADTADDQRVHNLTVADLHTYYVGVGRIDVLSHNQGDTGRCEPNWSPRSVQTFGHTFSRHGSGSKNTRNLTGRAASSGDNQGQWLNNDSAAEFLSEHHDPSLTRADQARTVELPEGMGQVIRPDGSIVPATHAILVPSRNGTYRTAYPTIIE